MCIQSRAAQNLPAYISRKNRERLFCIFGYASMNLIHSEYNQIGEHLKVPKQVAMLISCFYL